MASPPPEVRFARDEDISEVRRLIEEYRDWIALDLAFQEIDEELATLPGAYGPPGGVLLVAIVNREVAGLVAARRLSSEICEMKRLYVRPSARGLGLARQLVATLLAQARTRGYRHMYLDTLPMMDGAQQLYVSLGFRDIPPYYDTPVPGTRFMAIDL